MLARALEDAEKFRKQLPSLQYDATIFVQEWDGRGRLRGTARAQAIVRPGDVRPMTFLSREIQGKVKFPEENPNSKKEDEEKSTLHDFAREHQIPERFTFVVAGAEEELHGGPARRIDFTPNGTQPRKNTADRFLDSISGTGWIGHDGKRLVKFEMRLKQPFQLFWIFAVLKELSIQYELVSADEILGHARLKVRFALSTPIYSLRQQHEVELENFRRRDTLVAVQH